VDHLVDDRVSQQQPLDRVLSLPRPGQKVLRAAANHRLAMAQELFQKLLEAQHPGLPSTSARKISEKLSCNGENW